MFKHLFKTRRWIKFIDPKQQMRLAFEIVLLVLILPFLFYTFTTTDLFSMIFFGDQGAQMQTLFISQLALFSKAWHVVLISLLIIVVFSVFFTHKIFGPIFRFTQALESKLNQEDNIFCEIRKGDYFMGFSNVVKRVVNAKGSITEENNTDPLEEE